MGTMRQSWLLPGEQNDAHFHKWFCVPKCWMKTPPQDPVATASAAAAGFSNVYEGYQVQFPPVDGHIHNYENKEMGGEPYWYYSAQ
jgi:hypothetical protein